MKISLPSTKEVLSAKNFLQVDAVTGMISIYKKINILDWCFIILLITQVILFVFLPTISCPEREFLCDTSPSEPAFFIGMFIFMLMLGIVSYIESCIIITGIGLTQWFMKKYVSIKDSK